MLEPSCTFEWFHDGYRSIWLYDGTKDDPRFNHLCHAVGHASAEATSAEALTDVIERLAGDANLHVRVYPGPGHDDPLRDTFRVGVFTEPPVNWAET
jgi:hypothetical protein